MCIWTAALCGSLVLFFLSTVLPHCIRFWHLEEFRSLRLFYSLASFVNDRFGSPVDWHCELQMGTARPPPLPHSLYLAPWMCRRFSEVTCPKRIMIIKRANAKPKKKGEKKKTTRSVRWSGLNIDVATIQCLWHVTTGSKLSIITSMAENGWYCGWHRRHSFRDNDDDVDNAILARECADTFISNSEEWNAIAFDGCVCEWHQLYLNPQISIQCRQVLEFVRFNANAPSQWYHWFDKM